MNELLEETAKQPAIEKFPPLPTLADLRILRPREIGIWSPDYYDWLVREELLADTQEREIVYV